MNDKRNGPFIGQRVYYQPTCAHPLADHAPFEGHIAYVDTITTRPDQGPRVRIEAVDLAGRLVPTPRLLRFVSLDESPPVNEDYCFPTNIEIRFPPFVEGDDRMIPKPQDFTVAKEQMKTALQNDSILFNSQAVLIKNRLEHFYGANWQDINQRVAADILISLFEMGPGFPDMPVPKTTND